MEGLITTVTSTITGIFSAIITAFADVGNLIFTFSEGALTGVSPFGYFIGLIIGVPIGVKLFSALLSMIKRIMNIKFGN